MLINHVKSNVPFQAKFLFSAAQTFLNCQLFCQTTHFIPTTLKQYASKILLLQKLLNKFASKQLFLNSRSSPVFFHPNRTGEKSWSILTHLYQTFSPDTATKWNLKQLKHLQFEWTLICVLEISCSSEWPASTAGNCSFTTDCVRSRSCAWKGTASKLSTITNSLTWSSLSLSCKCFAD